VRTPFSALVLTQWRAPFTGGDPADLPIGLEFVVLHDPSPEATAIAARPDPYEEWEPKLVSPDDFKADKYGGYYLVVDYEALGRHCALIKKRSVP
jgi:hypothetical protein